MHKKINHWRENEKRVLEIWSQTGARPWSLQLMATAVGHLSIQRLCVECVRLAGERNTGDVPEAEQRAAGLSCLMPELASRWLPAGNPVRGRRCLIFDKREM